MTIPVLVINGSIGAGKTAVLGEVSDLLRELGLSFAAVDLDGLAQVYPAPPDDPFNLRLAADNLRSVWANAARQGAGRLVLASVVESTADLRLLLAAVPEADPYVCRLQTPTPVLRDRIRRREIGTGLGWHLERAAELAGVLEEADVDDVTVDASDRPLRDIAVDVLTEAGWPVPG